MAYNWDALGMMPTKPLPKLFAVALESFQRPIDFLAAQFRANGFNVNHAELDPYLERWTFYEHDGTFVAAVPHGRVEDLMSRLVFALNPEE